VQKIQLRASTRVVKKLRIYRTYYAELWIAATRGGRMLALASHPAFSMEMAMRGYTILLASCVLISSPALADKIVNADGDSFIEIEAQTNAAPSIMDTLNPVGVAQAQTSATPGAVTRPAADVPQMQAPAPGVEEMMRPDYTAESFR
jgi:hypothetical protein